MTKQATDERYEAPHARWERIAAAWHTDTTRPGETEAIEAVRRVLFETRAYLSVTAFAADLVAAAYPVIAAAVREQAAQDIEAMDEPDWHTGGTLGAEEMGWAWAQDAAARVVRGGR